MYHHQAPHHRRNRDIALVGLFCVDITSLRIIADRREQKSGIPKLLAKAGVNVESATLITGDYVVANETIVERKSVRDFVSSIADGRLHDQCARLRAEFKHPVLIVEGGSELLAKVIDNPFVFYAAISQVAIEFEISVIQTPNATHTAKLLISLGTRKGLKGGPLLKKQKKKSGVALRDQQINMLCGLPGIGVKLATRLLDRFGTPQAVMSATASELALVEKLGSARAKRLRGVLGTSAKTKPKRGKQKKL